MELLYLQRMSDISVQKSNIRELLYRKYNKEKFLNFIGQKENLVLIENFLIFLNENIKDIFSQSDLNNYISKIKNAINLNCAENSNKLQLIELF